MNPGLSAEQARPDPTGTGRGGRVAWLWIGAVALGVFWLWSLDAALLFDVDEGAFAEASREMLSSGDFGHTTLNGADRFDKPILVYWLQAAAMAVFGPTEFAARLPSGLAAWLWCLALGHFVARRFGNSAAWVSAGLLATSMGAVAIGRAATADALLNLLLTLAMLDLWRHLEQPDTPSPHRRALRRAAVWAGLGMLAKGPVALLIPAATLALWSLAGTATVRRQRLRQVSQALCDVPSWGLLLLAFLPWYGYAWHRHGMEFVKGFLLRHNVERFTSTLESHGGSVVYYAVAVPLLLLPWTPLLPRLLGHLRTRAATPLGTYLLCWTGFVLAFFSMSGTKLPHYVLYGFSPLAIFMALELTEQPLSRLLRVMLGTMPLLVVAAWAAAPLLLQRAATSVHEPMYRALLESPPDPSMLWLAAGVAALLCLGMLLAKGAGIVWRLLAANAVATLFVTGFAIPWLADLLQAPVQHAAAVARADGAPAVQWHLHQPSFAYYSRQTTPRRAPNPGELALVRENQLPPPGPWVLLYRERGIALIRWQAGTP